MSICATFGLIFLKRFGNIETKKLLDEEYFKDPTCNGVRHWVLILGLHGGTKAKEKTGNVGDLFFNGITNNGFVGRKFGEARLLPASLKTISLQRKNN